MARVALVVEEEQKERWQDYANEQPEFDNMSELIRRAVESEISQNSDKTGGPLEGEEIGEILEALDSIETGVNHNETQLKALRQENISEEEMEGLLEQVLEYTLDRILSQLHTYAPDFFNKERGQGWVNSR